MTGSPATGRHATAIALLAVLGLLAGTWAWVDGLRLRSAEVEVRGSAATTATPYAGSLGASIAKRLALVRGLSAFVTVELDKGDFEEEFTPFADALRFTFPGIRNLSVAPGFVIRLVNPSAGNEAVLGNDLLKDARPGFADTVRRAIATRDVTIHGPVPLLQGGVGLIARQVVQHDGRAWGAVGAVFDLPPILEEANLPGLANRYRFALRRGNADVFAGEPEVFALNPVVERIHVPDGDWELAVLPREGWEAATHERADRVPVAAAFLGAGLLALTVILMLADRRATLARLVEQRTAELDLARRDADRKAAQLALAQRELEQFAFAAAHDLQEPVRTMGSYAQLLQREIGDRLTEDRAALLEQVVEGAHRLKALLRDVQIFVAEGTLPLPDRPVRADEALDGALDGLAHRIGALGASVSRAPLPEVMADTRRLREIFVVLIGNALEYHHPDRPPRVHVEAQVETGREGAFTLLSVRDNGIGIEPHYFEQIFQVFRRLHGRAEHPGTGMGLAIAQKMAERLGGRIAVSSEPGQGSVFTVRLPTARQGTEA